LNPPPTGTSGKVVRQRITEAVHRMTGSFSDNRQAGIVEVAPLPSVVTAG
jgi:hypothetical protein